MFFYPGRTSTRKCVVKSRPDREVWQAGFQPGLLY